MGGPRTRAESRLDNGVRVVVEENHVAPVVAVQVWVAAGAADDPPALAGAAHLYEHLVFRGTRRRAPGAAAREIEAAGGTLGAWTGLDETVYHADAGGAVPRRSASTSWRTRSPRPTFDPAEVEHEKQAGPDEIAARGARSRPRAATELLRARRFAGGPRAAVCSGRPRRSRPTRAPRCWRTSRRPTWRANMTVVVVGDVDARAAREAVARAFAAVPRGHATAPRRRRRSPRRHRA